MSINFDLLTAANDYVHTVTRPWQIIAIWGTERQPGPGSMSRLGKVQAALSWRVQLQHKRGWCPPGWPHRGVFCYGYPLKPFQTSNTATIKFWRPKKLKLTLLYFTLICFSLVTFLPEWATCHTKKVTNSNLSTPTVASQIGPFTLLPIWPFLGWMSPIYRFCRLGHTRHIICQFHHVISQSQFNFGPFTFWGSTNLGSRSNFCRLVQPA